MSTQEPEFVRELNKLKLKWVLSLKNKPHWADDREGRWPRVLAFAMAVLVVEPGKDGLYSRRILCVNQCATNVTLDPELHVLGIFKRKNKL